MAAEHARAEKSLTLNFDLTLSQTQTQTAIAGPYERYSIGGNRMDPESNNKPEQSQPNTQYPSIHDRETLSWLQGSSLRTMTVQKSIQSLCLHISTLYTNITSYCYLCKGTINFYASVAQTLENRFV